MRGSFGLNRFINYYLKKGGGRKSVSKKSVNRNNYLLIAAGSILITTIYFYGIGRNRYITSADVVVRKSQNESSTTFTLGALLGSGNTGSLEDARYLKTYLLSTQVLEDLEEEMPFVKLNKRKFPDVFAGLNTNIYREQKYAFYRKQVSVNLDEISGILKVTTFGFDPSTSLNINNFLLNQAELFVNKLNQDIYKKQLDFAKKQVINNLEKLEIAQNELQRFQLNNKSLDLSFDAATTNNLIATLESNLAQKKVELATMKKKFVSPNAPEVLDVLNLVEEIEKMIENERRGVVSPEGKNLNKKVAKLNNLRSKLAFAEDLYKSALSTAESTRIDSLQQQRFLAIVSKPVLAEKQYLYWRHKGFLTILVIIIIIYFLSKFLLGLSENHLDEA